MTHDFGGFNMDITTYTMLLVCKLWGLTWSFRDGAVDAKQLTPDQIERKVDEFPSLLEYCSFVFSNCGAIIGPFFEYADFKNWIEMKGHYKSMPRGLSNGWVTIVPSITCLLGGFLCLGIHIALVMQGFSVYTCGEKGFADSGSFLWKVFYYFVAMSGQRFMYYTPFKMTDASMIACGIGYNGTKQKDDKSPPEHLFDRIVSIYVIDLETGWSCIEMMKYWNHMVHVWLNRYTKDRLVKPGEKAGIMATFAVFGVSAFWHGFYPFYYFMFMQCGCFVELCKDVYRSRVLFSAIPPPLNHVLSNFLTMLVLNYLGVSFNCLTFERGFNFGRATYYYVYILIPLTMFLWKALGIVKIAKKKEQALAAKSEKKEK